MNKNTKVLLGVGVGLAGLYLLTRKRTVTQYASPEGLDSPLIQGGPNFSITLVDPDGKPIPKRITPEVIQKATERMAMGQVRGLPPIPDIISGQISAFPRVEGVAHTAIVTLTNTSHKGGQSLATNYTIGFVAATGSPPNGNTSWPTVPSSPVTGAVGPAGVITQNFAFTPSLPGDTSTSVASFVRASGLIGPVGAQVNSTPDSAVITFVLTLIQTVYGATLVLTEG